MNVPFGSYRALARDLLELSAINQTGGELEYLIGLHQDASVTDWFDDPSGHKSRARRRRLADALVSVIREDEERHIEAPLYQSSNVEGVFLFAFRDELGREDGEARGAR